MEFSNSDLGDLVGRAREAYRLRQGHRLLPSHDRALSDIGDCRTAAMGGHRYRCSECGESFWVYHACGNRSCPACHGRDMREWLEKRRAQLLPCGYFHLVATVPAPIRRAFLADQETMYDLLMKTVAESVLALARDERFVGGTPGILMVLHTWSGELHYHPHVHLLVTAGGISDDSEHWREPKDKDFLVPVKALSKLIRRRFGEALKQLKPDVYHSLPPETWVNGWNSFCKGYGEGAEAVLRYLARYVFRIALTNARIVNMDDGHVTFRYKDRSTKQWRLCRLDDFTFLDRFLMHVLPKGFHKVRYYGLWHHSKKAQQTARRLLDLIERKPKEAPAGVAQLAPQAEALAAQRDPTARQTNFRPKCPRCGCERVIHLEELKRSVVARRHGAGP
jgi:predicted nucleic acid-binding Zn ribbon protein